MTDDHRARDAYFTRPHVARQVWADAFRFCRRRGLDTRRIHWIEPSAGGGVFITEQPRRVRQVTAVDIHPMHPLVRFANFFDLTRQSLGVKPDEVVVVIGNPPYGYRGANIKRFIHHALFVLGAEFVCFLVPGVATNPYFINQLRATAGMATSRIIDDIAAFQLPCGKAFDIGTAPHIAIYQRHAERMPLPINTHPDFVTLGLHCNLAADKRRKHPVPHRIYALKRIQEGGFAFAFKPINGVIIESADVPREWDAFDGVGYLTLVFPRRVAGDELLRRFRAIDWRSVTAELRRQGNARGSISPKHMCAAYHAQFGGLETARQDDIFATVDG